VGFDHISIRKSLKTQVNEDSSFYKLILSTLDRFPLETINLVREIQCMQIL